MDGHTTVVTRAAEIAASKGILVVNSVGNEGSAAWHYLIAPTDVNGDSLIAVGAVDAAGVAARVLVATARAPTAASSPTSRRRGVSNPLVGTSGNPQAYYERGAARRSRRRWSPGSPPA